MKNAQSNHERTKNENTKKSHSVDDQIEEHYEEDRKAREQESRKMNSTLEFSCLPAFLIVSIASFDFLRLLEISFRVFVFRSFVIGISSWGLAQFELWAKLTESSDSFEVA
jgi:hypothetical protein